MTEGRRRREAMSKVDTAWLRMEKPTNLMMITGVLMFGQRLSIEALRTLIAERFLAFRRFLAVGYLDRHLVFEAIVSLFGLLYGLVGRVLDAPKLDICHALSSPLLTRPGG